MIANSIAPVISGIRKNPVTNDNTIKNMEHRNIIFA